MSEELGVEAEVEHGILDARAADGESLAPDVVEEVLDMESDLLHRLLA